MKNIRSKFQRKTNVSSELRSFAVSVLTLLGFIICGIIEHSITWSPESYDVNNRTENKDRRYCDPPNVTESYYDSSEELTDEQLYIKQLQEPSFKVNISSFDIPKHRFSWGMFPSYFFASQLSTKVKPTKIFAYPLVLFSTLGFLQESSLVQQWIKEYAEYFYGFLIGCLVPPFFQLSVNWFVSDRRSSFISLLSGKYLGYAFCEFLTLTVSPYTRYKFYVHFILAFITFIWFFAWSKIVSNHPNPPTENSEKKQNYNKNSNFVTLLWKMLNSRPVWMSIAVIFGAACGEVAVNKAMMLYLKYVYYVKAGYLPGISYTLHFIFAVSCGYFVNFILKIKFVSVTSSRRMVVYVSHFIPAGLLFVNGFVGCDIVAPIVFYCIAGMVSGANYAGAFCSPLDLAPRYAGVLVALCFTIRTVGYLFMEYLIPYILAEEIMGSWRFLFSLNSLILLVTSIFFMLRGSGSVQPWNNPELEAAKMARNQQSRTSVVTPLPKPRKSIYAVEQKILKVLHVQEPDKFTRVRAYSTSLPNSRTGNGPQSVYRPTSKKRASIS